MSEEAKEKKKKATILAKLFGFFTVLSILGIVVFGLAMVEEGFSLQFTDGLRNKLWELIAGTIIAVSLVPAIALGVRTTKRWGRFKTAKKILLGMLVIIPIIPLVPMTSYLLEERLFEKSDYELGKGYTIHVSLMNEKEVSGRFVKWDKGFLILEGGTGYIHIPKDKIIFINQ